MRGRAKLLLSRNVAQYHRPTTLLPPRGEGWLAIMRRLARRLALPGCDFTRSFAWIMRPLSCLAQNVEREIT
ncbi:MAG: hypothetical protein M1582_02670 [Actinobacteria bacterium]|nr:hypothetical protein [Actinomycetota bacterium]